MMKGLAGKQFKQSQVLDRTQMVSIGVILLWVFAFGMIAISTYGDYVQAVDRKINNPWVAVIVFQGVCSLAQWAFKSMRNWPLYMFFLGVSVVPSVMTYHPLVHPGLVAALPNAMSLQVASWVASGIIVVALTLNDMAPEWILIK